MTFNDAQDEFLPDEMAREVMELKKKWVLGILQSNLGNVLNNSRIIRRIVSKNRKFKTIAISDPFKSWMVFMGEEEIGRSRNKPAVHPIDFNTLINVTLWELPLLNLPALGYALTDVKFFAVKPADKPPIQQPDVLQKCVWSNYDKDWTIFREASKEIMFNDNLMKQKSSIEIPNIILFGLLNPFFENFYSFTPPEPSELRSMAKTRTRMGLKMEIIIVMVATLSIRNLSFLCLMTRFYCVFEVLNSGFMHKLSTSIASQRPIEQQIALARAAGEDSQSAARLGTFVIPPYCV